MLLHGLLSDVGKLGASAVARELGPVLAQWDPEWGELGSYALAGLLGVAEPIARAAQAIMRDGDPDLALLERMPKTGVQSLAEKFGPALIASTALNLSYTDTKSAIREQQLLAIARMSDDALSFRTARAEQGIPLPTKLRPPSPALELDAVGTSPAPVKRPKTSAVGDVALGFTIAGAVLALVWWAKSS